MYFSQSHTMFYNSVSVLNLFILPLSPTLQDLNAKMEPVLLWENDNPSKNFASTTINMDLSNYKRFSVIMAQNTSYPNRVIDFTCRKGQSFVCTYCYGSGGVSGAFASERRISFTDDQISITVATRTSPAAAPANTSTDLIPIKIYGYKTD